MNNKPKIAIVHDFLIKLGGAEKVLEIIHQIFPEAPIYTLLYDNKATRNQFEKGYNIRTSYLQKYPKLIRSRQKLLLPKFPKAIETLDLSKYDIIISDSNSFAHGVAAPKSSLHITYCYSPTRYLWDWYHQYLDENNITFNLKGLYIRRLLSKLRIWDREASKRTNRWIAISKYVSKRLKKYYDVNSTVIYPPFTSQKEIKANKSDFYLILSRLTPYKKIDLAIEAFNINKKKLKIIGEGSDYSRLESLAEDNIEFLGYIEDEQKVARYLAESKALIFPGEEDFGLTPLEALSQGTPVIALKKGGVCETVIAGKTGEFFKKPNAKSLNQTIDKFENNISYYKKTDCIKRSKEFGREMFKNKFKKYVLDEFENHNKEN